MKQHSPSYSVTLRLRYSNAVGRLAEIASAIARADGLLGTIDVIQSDRKMMVRDVTFQARDAEHARRIGDAVAALAGVEVVEQADRTFAMHVGGKIETCPRVPLADQDDLSMAYTPGVARVCREIAARPEASFAYTIRANTVAVVSDGSAVLGLGNIGPEAAMPVMEGKAVLFKVFGGVNAFPICLATQDPDEIVRTVKLLAPTFGGINLEDISSPRCVEIEQRLIEELEIPVFHDDQHGTAVVVLAALTNALKVVGKTMENIRITISGAGAAGAAITRLLQQVGVRHVVVCDRSGTIYRGRDGNMNVVKQWLAENTNPEQVRGTLGDAMKGADVFIGVSSADVLTEDDVRSMAPDAVVFALANPDPEIDPALAAKYARVVATGRSDYPNQINNVLCFPGLFRGVFEVRARRITDRMKIAAALAIAEVVSSDELTADHIIPSVFDRRVGEAVARAVAAAAE
ncbi:MAG TPA: NAD-dependent malic enzyme [Thermoguttaceae bacterium]|nr:NAD-dependent malic enzyme [Thermoguttaceae bacterium]